MSAAAGAVEEVSSTSSDKCQRFIREYFDNIFREEELEEFERLLIQCFRPTTACLIASSRSFSTIRLFIFLNKACATAIPKRKDMKRILDKHSKIEEEGQLTALSNRLAFSGGRLNFLSDVWQNVAKLHLLECMLALFGTIVTYGLFPTGSRHDSVAIVEQMEKVMKDIEAKGWTIGAVVTDNAGQCGRARRILAVRHPRIAYIHCFAHDINNLVKSVLNTTFRKLIKQASLATVTLNTSSSKWLVRAQAVITATYGKPLGFINLCETRWNSMQGCFASLLRVRNALLQFYINYTDDNEFPAALQVFGDPTFWRELEAAEEVIRPLSNVSYKLQRDENTLADVAVSYRDIYRGFLGDFDNLGLVSLVEKRWHQCEQRFMLLALFLHPLHVRVAVAVAIDKETPRLRFLERLCGYGIYYYRRFVKVDNEQDVEGLSADLHVWYRGFFIDSAVVRFNGDVGHYWTFASDIRRESKLPKLAAVILSIAVNTVTCERYFSELAAIHTALKNRMLADKARKLSLIRQAIRQLNKAESGGKGRTELRRIVVATERKRVGNCDTTPPITIEEVEENHVIALQETLAADAPEYWQDVFDVLDGDAMLGDDEYFSGCDDSSSDFRREGAGSLTTLFPSENTFGLTPYLATLEA